MCDKNVVNRFMCVKFSINEFKIIKLRKIKFSSKKNSQLQIKNL